MCIDRMVIPHVFGEVVQVASIPGLVWPVCSIIAGDEDVEEGEGQNENSGESDEVPPKVKVNNFFLTN